MTWVKLDDRTAIRLTAEVEGATFFTLGMYSAGLLYANLLHTGGELPKAAVYAMRMGRRYDVDRHASMLVDAGWWADEGDCWRIVDYERDQSVAMPEEVERRRKRAAARQARRRAKAAAGAPSGAPSGQSQGTVRAESGQSQGTVRAQSGHGQGRVRAESGQSQGTEHEQYRAHRSNVTRPRPGPARPVPDERVPLSSTRAPARAESREDEDWSQVPPEVRREVERHPELATLIPEQLASYYVGGGRPPDTELLCASLAHVAEAERDRVASGAVPRHRLQLAQHVRNTMRSKGRSEPRGGRERDPYGPALNARRAAS